MTCHLGRLCFPHKRSPRRRSVTSIPLTVANFAAIFFVGPWESACPNEDQMIGERESMSIIYALYMTAVILALIVLFELQSRYAAKQLNLSEHDIS